MRIIGGIVFHLLMISSLVWAAEIPVLQLEDGVNEIKLTVSNNYFTDLQKVKVEVESGQLPEWLNVEESVQVINIKKGQKSTDQLILKLVVDGATENSIADLPFSLSDGSGNTWSFDVSVKASSVTPSATVLNNNFPNPFNPTTTISYSLKNDNHAKLAIYNSLGQLVRTLIDGPGTMGNHIVHWDGRNNSGQNVSSGVYLYTLISGDVKQTKRMMMVE